jgi:hypothetical protein
MKQIFFGLLVAVFSTTIGWTQVNSGSDGSDGALNVTNGNFIINMADHPTGVYKYTSVYIGASITFIPNANNTPVVWLVQSNVVIDGTVDINGHDVESATSGTSGPGGGAGGTGGSNPSAGQGLGGGSAGGYGGNASFGSLGSQELGYQSLPGSIYGNSFLIPLLGGSGGGGGNRPTRPSVNSFSRER